MQLPRRRDVRVMRQRRDMVAMWQRRNMVEMRDMRAVAMVMLVMMVVRVNAVAPRPVSIGAAGGEGDQAKNRGKDNASDGVRQYLIQCLVRLADHFSTFGKSDTDGDPALPCCQGSVARRASRLSPPGSFDTCPIIVVVPAPAFGAEVSSRKARPCTCKMIDWEVDP